MRIEDIEVGMEVKALQKSVYPETFKNFLSRYPDGVAPVRGTYKSRRLSRVKLDDGSSLHGEYHFLPEDLIPAKIANQTMDDFKVGMRVKAHRKSALSASWEDFLEAHPDGIGDVRLVSKRRLTIGVWDFLATDLEILDPPKEEIQGPSINEYARLLQVHKKRLEGSWYIPTLFLVEDIMTTPKSNMVAFKPITCQAIAARVPASCGDFKEFVKRVSGVDMHYLWDPIPPELAQGIAVDLGYPTWFEDHGFIAIEGEKPGFDPLKVTLAQEKDKVRIRYNGVSFLVLSCDGAYRSSLPNPVDFPLLLEEAVPGRKKVFIQN